MYEYIYGGVDFFIKNGFVITLIISYIPFSFLLKKCRKLFWLRSAFCFAVTLCISNFYRFNTDSAVLNITLEILYFPLIITLFIISGVFIYKNSVWNVFFCGLGMVTLRHATNRIYTVVFNYIEYACHLPVWVYAVIYWIFFVLADLVVYFIYLRNRERYGELRTNNKKLVIFVMILILITIVLDGMGLSFVRLLNIGDLTKLNIMSVISIMSGVISIVMLNNLFNNANNTKLETDIVKIKQLWEDDRKHYDLSKQYIEQINIKYHDLKYALNTAMKDNSDLQEINDCIKQYDTFIKTGNETLDVLINEKAILCKGLNIQLACIADGEIINHLNPLDVYSLLGNALDNAIEAVKDFTDDDKKHIELMLHRSGDMALISVENPIGNTPVFRHGLPQTTKADSINHGFGIKSMKMIVEKYKGCMNINTDNSTFSLQIALPIVK